MRISAHDRLYAIPWLTDFMGSLFIFTVTRHLAERDANPLHLGILGGCGSLAYAVSAAGCGHLADRLGPRRLMGAGALLYAANFGLTLHTLAVPFIFMESAVAGVALGLTYPPLILVLSRGQTIGDRRRSATSPLIRFCLSWNLGIICGQASGGALFAVDPSLSLKVGLVTALVVFLLILVTRTDPAAASTAEVVAAPPGATAEPPEQGADPVQPAAPPAEPDQSLPAHPRARLVFFAAAGWLSNLSAAMSMSLLYYMFPQLATHLGISSPVHGLMLTTTRAAMVGVYLALHLTTFWRHRLLPGLTAQTLAIVGLILIARGTGTPVLTAGLICVGAMMGYNYFSGIFYSTTGFGLKRRGLASGIHEATIALGFVVGSVGGGYLSLRLGLRSPYLVCMVVLLASMVLQSLGFLWVRRRTRWATGPYEPDAA